MPNVIIPTDHPDADNPLLWAAAAVLERMGARVEIAVGSEKKLFVDDKITENRQEFDEELGVMLDRIILQFDRESAIEALPKLIRSPESKLTALTIAEAIAHADDEMHAEEAALLSRIRTLLSDRCTL